MNKKIILLAVALMLFAGVVSASSINGDYKGSPIVTVTSNGKLLETDEVPGMILDGHTVVPISLLRQLGASVTWDAYAYNVEVKLPGIQSATNKNDIPKIANEFKGSGYRLVQLMSDGTEYLISFVGTKPLSELLADTDTLFKLIQRSLDTEAAYIGVEGSDGYRFSVKATAANDYFSGKITLQAFKDQFLVDGKPLSASNGNQPIQPVEQTQLQSQANNAQLIAQYNLLSDFYVYLQNSVKSISNFVNTSDQYYFQWNSRNPAAPLSLEDDVKKTLAIMNEIYDKSNEVYPQINMINTDKTSELIKEIYSLAAPINKTYESISGWKASKFDLTDEKYKQYNTNLQVAEQYLNEYKSATSDVLNKIIQITNKLKTESDSQKNIIQTLNK